MPQIRRATPHDAGPIATIQQQVWPAERIDIVQIVEGLADSGHMTFVSIDSDESILGFADAFRTQSKAGVGRWEIDLVAVSPEAQCQGVGSQLVEALTQAGQTQTVQLARALVQAENHAMHHTLTKVGFTCEAVRYQLFVGEATKGEAAVKPVNLHIVPVNTLSYKGVWIEDDWSLLSFQYCQSQLASDEIAGALIKSTNLAGVEHAKQSGFTKIKDYEWWTWHY